MKRKRIVVAKKKKNQVKTQKNISKKTTKTKLKTKAKTKLKSKVQSKLKLKTQSKQKVKSALKSKTKVSVKKQIKVKAAKKKSSIKKTTIDYSQVINPLGERLLIRIEKAEKVSSTGLIIVPDNVETVFGYIKATVLAVGTGYKNKKGVVRPFDVQIGDVILCPEYATTEVKLDDEVIYLVNESDILGIMSK